MSGRGGEGRGGEGIGEEFSFSLPLICRDRHIILFIFHYSIPQFFYFALLFLPITAITLLFFSFITSHMWQTKFRMCLGSSTWIWKFTATFILSPLDCFFMHAPIISKEIPE